MLAGLSCARSFTRDAAGWIRRRSASKSRPALPAMTISPSATQRSGNVARSGARARGNTGSAASARVTGGAAGIRPGTPARGSRPTSARRATRRPRAGRPRALPASARWRARSDMPSRGDTALVLAKRGALEHEPGQAMAARKKELLQIDGREVAISNPDKLYFREAGVTKLELVQYYLSVAEGALRGVRAGRWRSSATSTARRASLLPEARAGDATGLDRDRRAHVPVGPHGAGDRGPGRGAARLGGQPGLHRSQPAPGARRRPRAPRRAARRPRSGARRGWDQIRARGAGGARGAREHGLVGWPKTSGSRGIHVYVRIEPRWTFERGAPRGAGAGARGGAARAGTGDEQVVEGGAARRLPRLQPEREGPHGRVGVLGAPDARRAGVDAARVGRAADVRPGGVHAATVPARFARARRRRGRHRRRGGLARAAAGAVGAPATRRAKATRPGRRTTRRGRRAPARGAFPPQGRALAARAFRSSSWRARRERRTRSRASSAGRQRHPEAAARLAPEDVLVDAMRGRYTTWTRVRVNLQHVPRRSASAGAAGSRLRPAEMGSARVRPASGTRAWVAIVAHGETDRWGHRCPPRPPPTPAWPPKPWPPP